MAIQKLEKRSSVACILAATEEAGILGEQYSRCLDVSYLHYFYAGSLKIQTKIYKNRICIFIIIFP